MTLVFIDPGFQEAVVLTGDYLTIMDSFKDFMEHKGIKNIDLLWGNYGDWQIYIKADPHLEFYRNISKVFVAIFDNPTVK